MAGRIHIPHTSALELDMAELLKERIASRVAEASEAGRRELEVTARAARAIGEREERRLGAKSLVRELEWLDTEVIVHSTEGATSKIDSVENPATLGFPEASGMRPVALAIYDEKSDGSHRIELFELEIARRFEALQAARVPCTYNQVHSLYLAHEYFHIAERTYLGMTPTRVPPVRTHDFFGWHAHELARTSEVAANAFAQAHAAFPLHPALIDYVYEQYCTGEFLSAVFGWTCKRDIHPI